MGAMIKTTAKPYIGQHCESTATGTLLNQIGIALSEPMLFGLGEGLSFIFWNSKQMDFPFIGGRVKPDLLSNNIARNLGLKLTVKETTSPKKAWQEVKRLIDDDKAVGLKLDCFHLEYFSNPVHFAGHYVAMIGYDDERAYLVDTKPQGSEVSTSLESLARARSEKGPMSSRNLYYIIERKGEPTPLKEAVLAALQGNAKAYLDPPISNVSYKGIEKASREIVKWFDRAPDAKGEFGSSAILMERAGTGGALFRNLYRDFLKEAYALTGDEAIERAHRAFVSVAKGWSDVIALFEQIGKTGEREYVLEARARLKALAGEEKAAIELLIA